MRQLDSLIHPLSSCLQSDGWGGYSPVTLEDLAAAQPVSELANLSTIVWTLDHDGFDAGPRTWAQLEADKASNHRVPTSPYTLYTTPYASGVVSQLRSANPDLDVQVHAGYRVKDDNSGLESYIYLWVKAGDETKVNEAKGINLPVPTPEGEASAAD